MAKRKTVTYNPDRTRTAIVKAGLELFESGGYHATSVSSLARKAGITKGAFYHHFESKEHLLLLIHDEYSAFQMESIQSALQRGGQPAEQVENLILSMIEGVEKYRHHVTVFFQERRTLSKKGMAGVRKKRNKMENTLLEVLERGVASGDFRADLDTKATCLGILGMCAWTYQWFSSTGRLSAQDLAAEFSKLALQGIAR